MYSLWIRVVAMTKQSEKNRWKELDNKIGLKGVIRKEMRIVCDICGKKFKTKVFTAKLCPKCKLKHDTVRYRSKSIKELINWEEWNKDES